MQGPAVALRFILERAKASMKEKMKIELVIISSPGLGRPRGSIELCLDHDRKIRSGFPNRLSLYIDPEMLRDESAAPAAATVIAHEIGHALIHGPVPLERFSEEVSAWAAAVEILRPEFRSVTVLGQGLATYPRPAGTSIPKVVAEIFRGYRGLEKIPAPIGHHEFVRRTMKRKYLP